MKEKESFKHGGLGVGSGFQAGWPPSGTGSGTFGRGRNAGLGGLDAASWAVLRPRGALIRANLSALLSASPPLQK